MYSTWADVLTAIDDGKDLDMSTLMSMVARLPSNSERFFHQSWVHNLLTGGWNDYFLVANAIRFSGECFDEISLRNISNLKNQLNVRRLCFDYNNLHDENWSSILKSKMTGNKLKKIEVRGSEVGQQFFQELGSNLWLKSMSGLSLTGVNMDVSAFESYLDFSGSPSLVKCSFRYSGIRDSTLELMAFSERFKYLRSLDVSANELSFAGVDSILSSAFFPVLEVVYLGGKYMNTEGLEIFFGNKGLSKLRKVALSYLNLLPHHIETITKSGFVHNIEFLGLSACGIDGDGVRLLFDSKDSILMSNVKYVCLDHNSLSDESIELILNSKLIRKLKGLSLYDTRLSDYSLSLIANSESVSCLDYINLYPNQVSLKATSALANSRFLNCKTKSIWRERLKYLSSLNR